MQFSIIENHELPSTTVFHEILKNIRKCLWDILPWIWYAQHNTNKIYNSKMRSKHENMWNKHHTTKINKTHITNSTKKELPKPYLNIIFSNLNKNSKIKKSKAINMKYFEKNRKPIPFLEVWSRDDEEKWWIFGENTVSLWERWTDKTINSQNEWGKTEKFLKKAILKV